MRFRTDTRRGFTLVELLVVLGILATLIAAFSVSVTRAQERANVARAQSETRAVMQAILAYENYAELQPVGETEADAGSLGFLLGDGGSTVGGDKIPSVLMASLRGGGKMRDPWGTPYKFKIEKGKPIQPKSASENMRSTVFFPNYYRLSKEERR